MRWILLFMAIPTFAQVPSTYDGCPAAVQDLMQSIRTQYNLAGVQIAVATSGTLGCAGSLGYADLATQRALTPTTLMRVGSISKTITGMAVAKLYEDGKLGLDDKVIDLVPDLLPEGGPVDARWRSVTIRHLLQHSMGWDRAIGGEPSQDTVDIAKALGIRAPATSTDVIRWLLQQPLHFTPGSKESYTGVEYSFLAVIVERIAKVPFELYVRGQILAPSNVRTSMRVGRTLEEGRGYPNDPALFESAYHSPFQPGPSVFPYVTGAVPRPYGEWYQEALEGSGGWTANAPALLRYVNKMFGRGPITALFKPETIQAIQARPSYAPANAPSWYGMGWIITPASPGVTIEFSGALRGTLAFVKFLSNGNSYAFITNSSTADGLVTAGDISAQLDAKIGPLGIGGANLFQNAKYIDGTAVVPFIRSQKGVVQGASFERGVTAGSWFSILGWNLATTTRLWAGADFTLGNKLPTKLDGVEVKINGQSAAVYYVSPTQINAQVPGLTVTGTATLQVIRDGIASNPEPIEVRPSSPEFFRYYVGSSAFVVATHQDASVVADPVLVPGLRAARSGETITLYGTGFVVAPAGDIVNTVVPVTGTTVKFGTTTAQVSFSGLTATGLFQVNVLVPQLAAGDYPVSISVGSVANLVTGIVSVR
ncbi:MAG: serine hydrolase [Bryobacteraceae bacterium]